MIHISTVSSVPIYQQIKQEIQELILSGQWAVGSQIPSIRSLAKSLQVGIITTTKAYDELVLEGYLISRPGIGFFVNELDHEEIQSKYIQIFKNDLTDLVKQTKGTPINIDDLIQMLKELKEEE